MANVPNQQQARPPLYRGNTVPLYVRPIQSASSADADNQQAPLSARPGGAYATTGSRAGDQFARSNAPPPANGRYPQQAQWQVPPTPPLSTSPSSAESYADYYAPPGSSSSAQTMHGQPHYGHAPPNGMRAARSHGLDIQMDMKSPTATTSPASFDVLRSTRRGSTTHTPGAPMRVETTTTEHILSAHIGPGFNSNCITIAARKGNILDIVADRWDLEDYTHEWHVQFDRDADMRGVHASYSDDVLTVRVKRLNYASPRPPQIRS